MPSCPAAFGTFPVTRLQHCVTGLGRALPRNRIGKRLSGWLRSLAQGTAAGPVDIEVLGVRMRLHLDNNASERRLLVTPHFFDPNDLEILASQITPSFDFVDLGANVGVYSLFVARLAGPGAKILAVEPHPVAARRLHDNIALNGFRISVAETAVAEHDGTLKLAVDSNNIGATTVRAGRRVRGHREQITVPACTLHGLVTEHAFERIDALKLDIEGAEGRALRPFLATAPQTLWPRLILLEAHVAPGRCDLITELEALGWRQISDRRTDNCVLQRT
jgi:FkbM family methyltransferase